MTAPWNEVDLYREEAEQDAADREYLESGEEAELSYQEWRLAGRLARQAEEDARADAADRRWHEDYESGEAA